MIVAVNGDRVESNGDLMERIYALKPGANATLTYTRGGKIATINVVPADGSKPGP